MQSESLIYRQMRWSWKLEWEFFFQNFTRWRSEVHCKLQSEIPEAHSTDRIQICRVSSTKSSRGTAAATTTITIHSSSYYTQCGRGASCLLLVSVCLVVRSESRQEQRGSSSYHQVVALSVSSNSNGVGGVVINSILIVQV